MKTKTLNPKKIVLSEQFCVNPDYVQERTGNYDRRDNILQKWTYDSGKWLENSNGNIHSTCVFSTERQSFEFHGYEDIRESEDGFIRMYRMMSAPLLLYRLIATFFGAPECFDNYKNIWSYTIKHIPTGKLITFAEWKGAIGFWLKEVDHNKLPKDFKKDFVELLNYIFSEECAHPYDNLVAGSVA